MRNDGGVPIFRVRSGFCHDSKVVGIVVVGVFA